MPKQGRAIGADDLARVAHVEVDMRMIEGRQFADAHELPRSDLDHRNAGSIVKVRNNHICHGSGQVNCSLECAGSAAATAIVEARAA